MSTEVEPSRVVTTRSPASPRRRAQGSIRFSSGAEKTLARARHRDEQPVGDVHLELNLSAGRLSRSGQPGHHHGAGLPDRKTDLFDRGPRCWMLGGPRLRRRGERSAPETGRGRWRC